MKRLWDNYIEIGSVQKSAGIKLVVAAGIREGVRYINIREFYKRKRDNVWMPGRDGISFPLTTPTTDLDENGMPIILKPYEGFIDLISKAADMLPTMAVIDEEHAVYMEEKKL